MEGLQRVSSKTNDPMCRRLMLYALLFKKDSFLSFKCDEKSIVEKAMLLI
jgi:hypothetical protein